MTSETLAILYGLTSAAVWGTGDFTGGLATKRVDVYRVVLLAHFIGLILFMSLALLTGEALASGADLRYGAVAGLAGMVGLLALYRGLADNGMGITAPLAAVVTAVIPIIVGAMIEGLPSSLQLVGFGVGLVAVWFLAGSEEGEGIHWRELTLPVVAGVGFGFFLVLIDRVSGGALFWPLTASRAASVIFLVIVIQRRPQSSLTLAGIGMGVLPLILLSGVFDAGGNAFAMLAAQTGRLDIASILSSLYPASTVLLAWLLLGERLSLPQRWGAVLALAAVVLITV